MKTTVIHHSADFDGLFCREIARKFLPDAELIGWDFGNKPLEIPAGPLYVMDLPLDAPFGFSYAKVGNKRGPQHPAGLVWIDHHKSAIESHPKDIPGYRIDGVAACRLAWQWFVASKRHFEQGGNDPSWFQSHYPFPGKSDFVDRKVSEPLAVRLAGEYDIWDKRDPRAELFQHGLRSREITRTDWELLLTDDISVHGILAGGSVIQYFKTQENEGIIKSYGFDVEFEGLKFLACNHARFNSHLFTAGIKPEHDALLGFNWSGKDWRVSLYHAPGKEHHDLSLIAVKHGGGGHKGACGFRAEKLPFLS